MDGLLAEINAKRKELETDVQAGPSKKYMRRAEVEAAKEEEDRRRRDKLRKEREEREAAKAAKARSDADSARNTSLARLAASPAPGSMGGTPEPSSSSSVVEKETFNISPEECIRRLRSKGQPIRLFGETDKDRRLRLRALELLEERGGGRENEFRKTVADLERGRAEKEAAGVGAGSGSGNASAGVKSGGGGGGKEEKKVEVGLIDMGLVKTDPNKLYPLIYYALKNVLKEWEEWMDARPEDIRRSSAGKLAAANQAQSAINLKPLFRQLRSRDMLPDVLRLLAEIVHHMQLRQYQKANDAYLRLSIGNAAWPIGVTSVGIHERNARERITEDSVAHVLNDEVSRKYIQAVKRLLTFSQTVRPPKDISQLMG